ncbi:MAG: TrkA family potassium uptake protein, partial [Christensenella sp.]
MKKQYVVIGMGRFGTSVAKTLVDQGADVLVIDGDEEKVDQAINFATHAVQADATDEQALKSLGIRNFDVACVCLGEIQSSIMAALICKEQGIDLVVVKAQSEVHAKVLYKMGVDKVVFPERDMGIRVAHNLISSSILDFIELSDDYGIAEIEVDDIWAEHTLIDLDFRKKYGVNIIAI